MVRRRVSERVDSLRVSEVVDHRMVSGLEACMLALEVADHTMVLGQEACMLA